MDEDAYALGDLAFVPQEAVTLFEDRAEMNVVVLGLADEGFAVHIIDFGSDAAMLAGLGRALDWQAQFGQPLRRLNLDALADALRGAPADEDGRLLLVLDDFRAYEARDPRRAEGLIEAIRDAAADHLEVGRRLLAFVCTEEPDGDGGEDDGDDGEDEDEDGEDGEDGRTHGNGRGNGRRAVRGRGYAEDGDEGGDGDDPAAAWLDG